MSRSPITELAEAHCLNHGHRFTEPRRQVLDILSKAGKPIGAYDIIAAMPKGTKPPTVYRALEFWEQEGFVHGISSLNVYTVCHEDHRHNGSQFMICDGCGLVEEVHLCRLPASLQKRIGESGFMLSRWNTELHGRCAQCRA